MELTHRHYAGLLQGLVVLLGFSLTGFLGYALHAEQQRLMTQEFNQEYLLRVDSFKQNVLSHLATLHSLAILFETQTYVTKPLFKRVSAELIAYHSGIQALEWAPRVVHESRAEFEQEGLNHHSHFSITERHSSGAMQYAAERSEYYPIQFVEPIYNNEIVLGFDLLSDMRRKSTIQASRDLALPLATSSLKLVQDPKGHSAFLAMRPVYLDSPVTVLEKREHILGFVVGVFKVQALIAQSKLGKNEGDIAFTIKDVTEQTAQELHRDGTLEAGTPPVIAWIEVWGRDWQISATPSAQFIASRTSAMPYIVLVIGFLSTTLTVLYVRLLYRKQLAIAQAVRAKTYELDKANAQLQVLTQVDGLTQVSNRRLFDLQLQKEFRRAARISSPISLLVVDIDYFKEYNDRYGHIMGDECLRSVAQALNTLAKRPCDVFARIGGEEFVFILPDTERVDSLCDQCLEVVQGLKIRHEGSDASKFVSVSIGGAVMRPSSHESAEIALNHADRAMYTAKENGRNCAHIVNLVKPNSPQVPMSIVD
ncbi:CHASE domain-containing protein [Pseudoalteromonas umbrosa]|uniref:CHASE domain-containing protein n=1 Tax=Pseudoalteromonas umbrosa TaxID=3048489 RepID=UPI0024C3A1AE|nr:diguanylate cyclase [Pseudoalteromonas sp. B95]MDK1290600.1 diguanylate cyclase [Pseudoalteromonas sp. B95]